MSGSGPASSQPLGKLLAQGLTDASVRKQPRQTRPRLRSWAVPQFPTASRTLLPGQGWGTNGDVGRAQDRGCGHLTPRKPWHPRAQDVICQHGGTRGSHGEDERFSQRRLCSRERADLQHRHFQPARESPVGAVAVPPSPRDAEALFIPEPEPHEGPASRESGPWTAPLARGRSHSQGSLRAPDSTRTWLPRRPPSPVGPPGRALAAAPSPVQSPPQPGSCSFFQRPAPVQPLRMEFPNPLPLVERCRSVGNKLLSSKLMATVQQPSIAPAACPPLRKRDALRSSVPKTPLRRAPATLPVTTGPPSAAPLPPDPAPGCGAVLKRSSGEPLSSAQQRPSLAGKCRQRWGDLPGMRGIPL